MELKVSSGGIGSPKRDMFRCSRSRNQKTMMSNLMEAIAEMNSGGVVSETKEDGVVRMKLKVRKEDLRQMLEMMRSGNRTTSTNYNNTSYSSSSSTTTAATTSSSSLSVEQRLNLLRRKHLLRGNNIAGKNGSRRGRRSWSPVLQSIPEEL